MSKLLAKLRSTLVLEDRIVACAERHFQRSGCTEFPKVRQVARRCRCRQSEVESVQDSGRICLDGVNVEGWRLGDLEVYVFEGAAPEAEGGER